MVNKYDNLKGVEVPQEIADKMITYTEDLSEEDLLLIEEQAELYQPNNQTIINLDIIPNCIYPICPTLFLIKATSFLKSKGVVLSKDLPEVIKELCIRLLS